MAIGRREFLRNGLGWSAVFLAGDAIAKGVPFEPMNVTRLRIDVGASRPFKAVHASDTHLARADIRDDARKIDLMARRARGFPFAEHYLNAAVRMAEEEQALLFHTGDMYDFVSEANLEFAARTYASGDWFACVGNHEFSKYVGEAKEDAAYKADSAAKVSAAYPNDILFASRVVNGVNFVAFDNVYYSVTGRQRELFEKEVEKGLPIVALCHVPIYTPSLFAENLRASKGACAYVMGAPDNLVEGYAQAHRIEQQRADEATKDFVKWVKDQKLLKAVLAGHVHHPWQERISDSAVQYICGATYKGDVQLLEFC